MQSKACFVVVLFWNFANFQSFCEFWKPHYPTMDPRPCLPSLSKRPENLEPNQVNTQMNAKHSLVLLLCCFEISRIFKASANFENLWPFHYPTMDPPPCLPSLSKRPEIWEQSQVKAKPVFLFPVFLFCFREFSNHLTFQSVIRNVMKPTSSIFQVDHIHNRSWDVSGR
jgi:hypothetical protein